MTNFPAAHDALLCTGVTFIMSENQPPNIHGAGDDEATTLKVTGSKAGAERDALVTAEDGLECARQLFLLREGGPHKSCVAPVAELPIREEVHIGQESVKKVLGEKGSEERAAANKLAERGLIDLEEALGYWLADRFVGQLPADEDRARGVSKRASDKLATKKDKERWKEKARLARQAAGKDGACAEAVAAAGAKARADVERRFLRTVIDPNFQAAGLAAAAPAAPAPATAPAPAPAPAPAESPACAEGERQVQISRSSEVAYAITTAFAVLHNGQRGRRDPHFHEELEVAQVRYKHALRRLKLAYPGELFDGWGECSAVLMCRYAHQLARMGYPIPAAAAVAREVLAKPAYLVPVPSDACVAAACGECTCADCS